MGDFSAIILAAGSGSRMGSTQKKQYMEICGRPLICYPLETFGKSRISEIVLVVSPGDEEYVKKEIVERFGIKKVTAIVPGGSERCFSVYEGLKAVRSKYVLVHDGARCLIAADVIDAAMEAAIRYEACEVAVPSIDTVKLADDEGFVAMTPKRSDVWSVQTPQGFRTSLLTEAYELLFKQGEEAFSGITDDAMIVERAFPEKKIKLVMGSYDNIKVTTPGDLAVCEKVIEKRWEKRNTT